MRLSPFYAGELLQHIANVFAGNLGFGDGTDVDNIRGIWITYTTNATPDTEDAIAHNMGVVPIGALEMLKPQVGYLYRGTTSWTAATIYMKCSASSQTVRLFLLLPSQGA
jgi:hypothetical protein